MNIIFNDLTTTLAYGFLYLTVIFLWVPNLKKFPLWSYVLILALFFGMISQRLDLIAFVFISLLGLVTYGLQNQKLSILLRVLSAIALLILGIGLEAHLFPGFQNLKVLDKVQISQDGIPFSLYLNFDKTLVGIFILGMTHHLISTKSEWVKMFKTIIPKAFLVIFVIVCLSFAFKFIRFDPKIPSSLLIWVFTNLLFVCLAEEAFFRGFIQKYLCEILQRFHFGNLIAIMISSIAFGLAHFPGGILYMILATVAGIGYGYIYFRTKRIEASIIAHFSVNLTHFLLFTYPKLASAVA